jgi:hypothetical protein
MFKTGILNLDDSSDVTERYAGKLKEYYDARLFCLLYCCMYYVLNDSCVFAIYQEHAGKRWTFRAKPLLL